MLQYIRLIRKFNNFPTFCNFLQLVAYDTWKRIEFARTRVGLKIFETTITQNILYEFRVYSELYPNIGIRMFEAIDEPNNGNDIELILQTKQGYILIPIQSKIIYSNNHYDSMEHGNQINDLIAYGDRVGGIPMYLLYNYYSNEAFNYNGNLCDIKFNKEQFGCSLVSARYLYRHYAFKRTDRNGNIKWIIPDFTDLHPSIAIPWFILGCCINSGTDSSVAVNLLSNSSKIGSDSELKFRVYKIDELTNQSYWRPFELKAIDRYPEFEESNNELFSPRFRILISNIANNV